MSALLWYNTSKYHYGSPILRGLLTSRKGIVFYNEELDSLLTFKYYCSVRKNMPIIKDLLGNALNVKVKYTIICDLNFIITKRYPDGTKSPKFYAGYEATTGHWVASDKTKNGVISDIENRIHIIKRELEKRKNTNVGGLFG